MAASTTLETRLFINGRYVDANSTTRLTCHSTVNDEEIASVHVANITDVDAAVDAAQAAFPAWSRLDPGERAKVLLRFADLLEEHVSEIAYLEALCNVKPVRLFREYELPQAVEIFRYYAGWCGKLSGESFPVSKGFLKIVQREPLGVCAGVTAFNAPIMGMAMKAAPSLAAENTIILKASEKSPLSTLYLGKLATAAGVPSGVMNLLSGDGVTGSLLASHMGINKISFTGSVGTGRKIAQAAPQSNFKRVSLEMGGKSPSIIFPDADLDEAVSWCVRGILVLAGQVCFASSRVYVHESIREDVISRMKAAFAEISAVAGNPLDDATEYPPLVDQAHYQRVASMIEQGKAEATLVAGGNRLFSKGNWMQPSIFVDPSPNAAINDEEVFGPVVVISGFMEEKEVVALANDTPFGLSGAVFTQNLQRGLRVAGAITSGTVCINCCAMLDTQVPFRGWGHSGVGSELGKEGLLEYTQTKTVFVR
ncbi:aldehyde dehydrogenase family protein [Aspergillus chevalieri]|uniref:aldehyde dehydrogenase (NAD(+)) n=1 Tax=Aspergillus chevalieri TaxID=182096 RepID=A0A7R7VG19_ASPCH|nr:uncharacterized protein ACHE_11460A [Aspergillus chevalieri]BCR84058.1 hypothetical protein ACHE_11460A [Aspergillus chevalieri]